MTVSVLVYTIRVVTADPRFGPEAALPILVRHARGTYGLFIRDALSEQGFGDMPANGSYVLGLIETGGSALSDVISDMAVSKQRASQLVDTLVVRGYLERSVDPDDRRRMLLTLTPRGAAASDIAYDTLTEIDARLLDAVGAKKMANTKETLAALVELRHSHPH